MIAATNKNLQEQMAKGLFREDLYYRLNVVRVTLPPLRERIEDLPLLIETLLKRISPERTLSIHPTVLLCLSQYDFPGNIRELRNLLERASLLADGDVLFPEHFPQLCKIQNGKLRSVRNTREIMTLEEMELSYIEWQVQNSGLGREELAEKLGVSRRTLFRKLRKLQ